MEISMKKRGLTTVMIAALAALQMAFFSWAAQPGAVLGTDNQDGQVIFYVQNPGEVQEIKLQIGTKALSQVSAQAIKERELPLKTWILLDNSLSVTESYRPFIKQTLQDIVAARMDREQFTVAVFGEDIQYLVQDSSDYSQIKQVLDGITYQDRETYLTDVLYDLLVEMEASEADCFQRIIIISDGVDNKDIGYTKEELYELIGKQPYPVYTLGCTYKENKEQLKNMFALSRMTNARSYLLDEVTDSMTIVNDLAADQDILRISAVPEEELCDGSRKAAQLTYLTAAGEITAEAEVRMPFAHVEETIEPETGISEPETEPLTEPEETKEPETEEPEDEDESHGIGIGMVVAGVGIILFLMIGATVLIIVLVGNKRKREAMDSAAQREQQNRQSQAMGGGRETELLGQENQQKNSSGTQTLFQDSRSYVLYLVDQNNLAKTFECPMIQSVIIGRKPGSCQIVLDYEKSVSGTHCEIMMKNGKFYIRDLKSSNGTFVNGKRVYTQMEVYSGCILTLGRLNLKMEIR